MNRGTLPGVPLAALALAASCSSMGLGSRAEAVTSVPQATFLHAGFGAGPELFTDAAGNVVEERRYEPFGAPIDARLRTDAGTVVGDPDLVARDLNVLNKRTDAVTGWSDHGARWMAPETGRWLTPDPPVEGPDAKFMVAPWALHPYQYVDQNPIAYWDPDGRETEKTGEVKVIERSVVDENAGPLHIQAFGGEIKTSGLNVAVEVYTAKIGVDGSWHGVDGSVEAKAFAAEGSIGASGVSGKLTAGEVEAGASYGPVKGAVSLGVSAGAQAKWGGGKVGLEIHLIVGVKVEVDGPAIGRTIVDMIQGPPTQSMAASDGGGGYEPPLQASTAVSYVEPYEGIRSPVGAAEPPPRAPAPRRAAAPSRRPPSTQSECWTHGAPR